MISSEILREITQLPGVYLMRSAEAKVLYVGKAKNLKLRLASYFRQNNQLKTHKLMGQVETIETIVTANEKEALLLESNLIKRYRPRYNILFKDDKSYPYLVFSAHEFPQLKIVRGGAKEPQGIFLGPFPSGEGIKVAYDWVQKLFRLRTCSDLTFKLRKKPCLLYQLALCSGACVGKITHEKYMEMVQLAQKMVVNDRSLVERLTVLMEEAASKRAYEQAMIYRDQIRHYAQIQSEQSVTLLRGSWDVIAFVKEELAVIDLLKVRDGLVISNQIFWAVPEVDYEEAMDAFLIQYYEQHSFPEQMVLNLGLPKALTELLKERSANVLKKVQKVSNKTRNLMNLALLNASTALKKRQRQYGDGQKGWREIQAQLQLDLLSRMECFDVSHHAGEETVVSCIIWEASHIGPDQHIRYFLGQSRGNDLENLEAGLEKRYRGMTNWPEVIVIDGGKVQLSRMRAVIERLGGAAKVLAIAKDSHRKEGMEIIYLPNGNPWITIPKAAFRVFLQLRNEAHRVAIQNHRRGMVKKRLKLRVETIPGVGKVLGKRLLSYFGGIQALRSAGLSELLKVPGIGKKIAVLVYDGLHAD